MLDPKLTGESIKKGRTKKGLTQDEFAKKLYVSKQAVSNWERGINIPDEDLRDEIERILNIRLRNEPMNRNSLLFDYEKPDVKPLNEYNDFRELLQAVRTIVNAIHLDAYSHVVQRMIFSFLCLVLGYEIYYEDYCRHVYSDCPLDWNTTVSDIESLLNDDDIWPLSSDTFRKEPGTLFDKKIHTMVHRIGGELFEDFDENGIRNDFVQQAGRFGSGSGQELKSLIPGSATDILILFKSALFDLVEILSTLENSCE